MKIIRLDDHLDVIEDMLLPEIYCIARQEDSLVLGVVDEPVIRVLAIMCPSPYKEDEYELVYIGAGHDEDYPLIPLLLNHIEEICAHNGIKAIPCKLMGSAHELSKADLMLQLMDYRPIELNGHSLVYDVSAHEIQNFVERIVADDALMEHVKGLNDLPHAMTGEFLYKLGKQPIDPKDDHSCFFIFGGEIAGYMDFTVAGDGVLLMTDVYVPDQKHYRIAIPGMIAKAIKRAEKELSTDLILVMHLYKESLYEAIPKVFGPPVYDNLILEYRKKL